MRLPDRPGPPPHPLSTDRTRRAGAELRQVPHDAVHLVHRAHSRMIAGGEPGAALDDFREALSHLGEATS